jgi:calcium-dependent protein kinase
MHCLVEASVESAGVETVVNNGVSTVYFKIVIKLGSMTKRIIFYDKETDRDHWLGLMRECQGDENRVLGDFYHKSDQLLGEGAFGKVYKGASKTTGKQVAIKVLFKRGMEKTDLEQQMFENSILRVAQCPNVAKLLDFFEDAKNLYIVQELIEGTNLFDFITAKPRTEKVVKEIMRELITGLEFLNSMGIAHRDIKLENIMITTTVDKFKGEVYTPRYIDFGLSKVFLEGEFSVDRYGTLAYCSPEILSGIPHNLATDMWSLGVIFHILLSGTVPFISPDKTQFKRNIIKGKL